MKLKEYRGKELLAKVGIAVPKGVVVGSADEVKQSGVVKAQVVGGKRGKAGLISVAENVEDAKKAVGEILGKEYNKLPISEVLVEDKVEGEELYLSIVYDSVTRGPVIAFIKTGGVDVEEAGEAETLPFSANNGLSEKEAEGFAKKVGLDDGFAKLCLDAVECFRKFDCRILEINPLFKTSKGYIAGDCKITIDDAAVKRVEEFKDVEEADDPTFLSKMELEARKIDEDDHRGVSGKTFVELDGDIAVLASGGGASLTCMDALDEAGGKAANYTEYSGNPPREKVEKLTTLTLSKKGLKGCLVVGGTANFTDIFETLSGFCDGLLAVKPKVDYPIVIRRAGPRDDEAKKMVEEFAKKNGFDIIFYGEETPMTVAVKEIVKKVES